MSLCFSTLGKIYLHAKSKLQKSPALRAGFHFILIPILFISFILSVVNVFKHIGDGFLLTVTLIPVIFFCMLLLAVLARTFALKAQSRAIRAEESLRYFVLTGKFLPAALTLNQIIALRFAPDSEFLPLVDKAVSESLSPKEIKLAVQNWRGDYDRV